MTDTPDDVVDQVVEEVNEPAVPATHTDEISSVAHAATEPPRTFVQRYVVPLLVPVGVVLGVVFYVINVSRVFLAASEVGAVIVATILTVGILGGAALLSAAPRMRTSSIVLIVLGFFAAVLMAGLLTVGPSQPKKSAAPFPPGAADQTLAVSSFNIGYKPKGPFTLHTGYSNVAFSNLQDGSHTLTPQETDKVALEGGIPQLAVSGAGAKDDKKMFIGAPGTYTFFCSIPGHRAAGMVFTVNVTGPTVTQAQAASQVK
jgi:plastocyanin